jgi:hypothetical protein
MLTDKPPSILSAFIESDRMRTIHLPEDGTLPKIAKSIESTMKGGKTTSLHRARQEFLETVSRFYGVPQCCIRVLAARPLRVRENWTSELFGDYTPETTLIRVWMRTAVRKEITSFGTFLSHVPRVLPSSGFSAVQISRFMAHSRTLRTGRRVVSPRKGHGSKATLLGAGCRWTLENRLVAYQSRCMIGSELREFSNRLRKLIRLCRYRWAGMPGQELL